MMPYRSRDTVSTYSGGTWSEGSGEGLEWMVGSKVHSRSCSCNLSSSASLSRLSASMRARRDWVGRYNLDLTSPLVPSLWLAMLMDGLKVHWWERVSSAAALADSAPRMLRLILFTLWV
eukprot:GDKK01018791.1.p2 GENE.GDKK01018791.1~~GDKK01018791.1.p2  ORF type:complete len:119 (-),score=1.38 GDKK01018791.1:227-583(-)